ncbi:MAG: methyltransferase domain-containing protein [Anaerolineales bacterium]|nr:methyltransferase domain-containing protein [Anaerolineales bacterium]
MVSDDVSDLNELSRNAWRANASFWDERMGEGNHFVEVLIWPATERMLDLKSGERVLDIACGNGLTSRRMAAAGVDVVAFDFAEEMIEHAMRRTEEHADHIQYYVADATDEKRLLELGEGEYDAALCNMALFDIAEISPLLRALKRLLRPGGRFVFSVIHPCFNSSRIVRIVEEEDSDGEFVTKYALKIYSYMTAEVITGAAMRDQPQAQPYFHRPLQDLFGICFENGFMLDDLEERAFPPDFPPSSSPLSWSGKFSEIPPVLVGRMRLLEI